MNWRRIASTLFVAIVVLAVGAANTKATNANKNRKLTYEELIQEHFKNSKNANASKPEKEIQEDAQEEEKPQEAPVRAQNRNEGKVAGSSNKNGGSGGIGIPGVPLIVLIVGGGAVIAAICFIVLAAILHYRGKRDDEDSYPGRRDIPFDDDDDLLVTLTPTRPSWWRRLILWAAGGVASGSRAATRKVGSTLRSASVEQVFGDPREVAIQLAAAGGIFLLICWCAWLLLNLPHFLFGFWLSFSLPAVFIAMLRFGIVWLVLLWPALVIAGSGKMSKEAEHDLEIVDLDVQEAEQVNAHAQEEIHLLRIEQRKLPGKREKFESMTPEIDRLQNKHNRDQEELRIMKEEEKLATGDEKDALTQRRLAFEREIMGDGRMLDDLKRRREEETGFKKFDDIEKKEREIRSKILDFTTKITSSTKKIREARHKVEALGVISRQNDLRDYDEDGVEPHGRHPHRHPRWILGVIHYFAPWFLKHVPDPVGVYDDRIMKFNWVVVGLIGVTALSFVALNGDNVFDTITEDVSDIGESIWNLDPDFSMSRTENLYYWAKLLTETALVGVAWNFLYSLKSKWTGHKK